MDTAEARPTRALTTRVSAGMFTAIESGARRADVDVSRMTRRMLAYALLHMPETWVPTAGRTP